jgi:hypothetical protein
VRKYIEPQKQGTDGELSSASTRLPVFLLVLIKSMNFSVLTYRNIFRMRRLPHPD